MASYAPIDTEGNSVGLSGMDVYMPSTHDRGYNMKHNPAEAWPAAALVRQPSGPDVSDQAAPRRAMFLRWIVFRKPFWREKI
jgi:hypothetical protein